MTKRDMCVCVERRDGDWKREAEWEGTILSVAQRRGMEFIGIVEKGSDVVTTKASIVFWAQPKGKTICWPFCVLSSYNLLAIGLA